MPSGLLGNTSFTARQAEVTVHLVPGAQVPALKLIVPLTDCPGAGAIENTILELLFDVKPAGPKLKFASFCSDELPRRITLVLLEM